MGTNLERAETLRQESKGNLKKILDKGWGLEVHDDENILIVYQGGAQVRLWHPYTAKSPAS